jgi:hypothetical protein
MARARSADGAAAVEFALVSTILFPLLFGIIQYGLYFNDSLNARQGVRQAAREGVVRTFLDCPPAATDLAKLQCSAKERVGAITGPSYIKVHAPSGWAKGNPLVVCTIIESNAIGILPLPNSGMIRSKTQMSIESGTPAPTGGTAVADAPPSGQDWSWC